MEQHELPDGWVWIELQEIVEFGSEQVLPFDWPDHLFNYLALENIESGTARIIDFAPVYGAEIKSNKYKFTTDYILYGKLRPYLRKAIAPEFNGISATDLLPLKPLSEDINRHFLVWWLLSPQILSYAVSHQTGVKMPRLRADDLKRMPVPLAPTDEQRRIAEKIKGLFEQSRTTREALDEIPALLRQFRQSVLAAAFRGELTTRDLDDEPASVLLERILEERRRRWEDDLRAKDKDPRRYTYEEPAAPDTSDLPELPEGWVWASFEELLIELKNGYFSGAPVLEGQGIPILRISAVRPLSVSFDDLRYLERETIEDISDYLLRDGDLLFTRYNGSLNLVGVCGMVRGVASPIVYPDKLIRARVSEGIIPEYLEFYFGIRVARDVIEEKAKSSAGQQGISGKDLKNVPVAIAPLEEQRRIVARVQSLFTQADIVEIAIELARRRLDQLDQSILARALRGELVPQDPNDEPALVLLERIRAERERQAGGRASRQKDKRRR